MHEVATAIVASLREFFSAAKQRVGMGRPPKKLAQCLQVVLAAVARAPMLGGVSMARVADALELGAHGTKKLNARSDAADAFCAKGVFESLYDSRCKERSDKFSDEMVEWLVSDCWLSNDFTRESEAKKDEVYDPKTRAKDRQHHRLRWLEVPLMEFYRQVVDRGRSICVEKGWCKRPEDFHMSATYVRKHRPFWVKDPTRDVCLCRYHLEFDLLANGLSKLRTAIPCPDDCATCKAASPLKTGLQLRAALTCPRLAADDRYDDRRCIMNNCHTCSNAQLLSNIMCPARQSLASEQQIKWENMRNSTSAKTNTPERTSTNMTSPSNAG